MNVEVPLDPQPREVLALLAHAEEQAAGKVCELVPWKQLGTEASQKLVDALAAYSAALVRHEWAKAANYHVASFESSTPAGSYSSTKSEVVARHILSDVISSLGLDSFETIALTAALDSVIKVTRFKTQ